MHIHDLKKENKDLEGNLLVTGALVEKFESNLG